MNIQTLCHPDCQNIYIANYCNQLLRIFTTSNYRYFEHSVLNEVLHIQQLCRTHSLHNKHDPSSKLSHRYPASTQRNNQQLQEQSNVFYVKLFSKLSQIAKINYEHTLLWIYITTQCMWQHYSTAKYWQFAISKRKHTCRCTTYQIKEKKHTGKNTIFT